MAFTAWVITLIIIIFKRCTVGIYTNISYKVFFRTTSTGFYPVHNGSTMGSFISNSVTSCTNSEAANIAERAYIKIEISEQDLLKSVPELYKGTLYITASPE